MGTPFSFDFPEFLFRHPRICAVLSVKSLIFETCAPVILLFPSAGLFFAAIGVGFHYGIALFQNIDFVTWWGPFYAVFLWENPAAQLSFQAAFSEAPLQTSLVVGYLAVHLAGIVVATITGAELLPLSSFHMFSEPKNLWAPNKKKHFYLSDKPHASGTLKNYCFPFCRPQTVLDYELVELPFKYLVMVQNDAGQIAVRTNVMVTDGLKDALNQIERQWSRGSKAYLLPDAPDIALRLLDFAKAEFATAPNKRQLRHGAATACYPRAKVTHA